MRAQSVILAASAGATKENAPKRKVGLTAQMRGMVVSQTK